MSQTNFTPISIYYSTTASAVPTAANLVPGELAINTADGKLYYEDSSGVVQVLATKSTGSIGGSNTQVQFNNSGSLGGSSGLTWDGSFLTTSSIKNSALTSGRVTYAGASGLLSDSANLVFNGTQLGIATNSPIYTLDVNGDVKVTNTLRYYVGATQYGLSFANAGAVGTEAYQGTYIYWGTGSSTSATERMRITSAGLVGIGTSSPDSFTIFPSKLVVGSGTGNQQITIYSGTTSEGNLIFADGTSGSQQYMGLLRYDHADNAMKFYTNGGTLGMTQDSSGNLGLGVTPSASNLPTMQSTYALISGNSQVNILQNAYYNSGFLFTGSGYATQYQQLSGEHRWKVSTASGTAGNAISFTQAMTLDASGRLLVGTTSTTCGGNTISAGGVNIEASANFATGITTPAGNQFAMLFANGSNGIVGSISLTSTLTAYNVTSDQRLKTNVVDAPSGNINDIKVRSFDWIANGSHQEYGMVAQELIEVAPYAVTKTENPDDMMQVDYSKLVPMMIKEIQDLKQRIATLENK